MNGDLVTAQHVSKVFATPGEDVSAVRDASCTVAPAARIVLLGPSGSGKSTLLQLLGGLDLPTSGTVSWPAFGHDVRPRNVAFVFQNQTLIPALSVLENVELPLQLQGASDADARERAHAALERLGLAALSEKLPEELSGGQAQRVSFARALVGEPRLILADEPTGQLDAHTAKEFFDAVLPWIEEMGSAILVATHDRAVGERMSEQWTMRFGVLEKPA